MANRERPHALVILEDRAYKEILNGITGHFRFGLPGVIEFDSPELARGWKHVYDRVEEVVSTLERYPERRLIVCVDFDKNRRKPEDPCRRAEIKSLIEDKRLRERVFVFGAENEPESSKLRGSNLGDDLMSSCPDFETFLKKEPNYEHNLIELKRLLENLPGLIAR